MSLRARVFELPRERPERPTGVGAWLAHLDGWRLLTIYTALAVGLFGAAWIHPFSTVIGVGPDPPVFIWYLRWLPFALNHGMNPLFTNYLDYPDGINLMWQTSVPLLGLLMWPVTATLGPIFSYNLMMTASVALSAFCGFLACRRHVSQAWPAAVGGLLFGFSPYMLAQSLGHPHVAASFICPLMLIAFEEAVIRQQRSWWRLGLAIGGLAAAQLLISEEMLLTQALLAAMAVAVLWRLRPDLTRGRVAYLARAGGLAAVVLALVAAIPLAFQFFGPQAVHGTLPTSNVFVSDLAGFFLPTSLQALAPSAITAVSDRFGGTQYEGGAFIGLPLLAVLIGGAVRWWRFPVVQAASVLTMVSAALSLGVTLHIGGIATGVPTAVAAAGFVLLVRTKVGRLLPVLFAVAWLGLAVVPLLNNVVPSRLMVYVFLFAALLIAVFAESWVSEAGGLPPDGERRAWMGSAPPLWRGLGRAVFGARGIAIVLTALAVLVLIPRVPFATSLVQVPDFFTSGSALADGDVALVVPIAHDFESRAMLWQLSSGMHFRMPEGYANRPGPSLDPPETALGNALIAMQYGSAAPMVSSAFRSTALRELRQRDVRAVVVGPMDGQARIVEFLTEVIGTPPSRQGGVVFWRLAR